MTTNQNMYMIDLLSSYLLLFLGPLIPTKAMDVGMRVFVAELRLWPRSGETRAGERSNRLL